MNDFKLIYGAYLGLALLVGGVGLFGGCQMSKQSRAERQLEAERIKAGYVLYEENVIGNTTPERFYVINGKRAYVSIDGIELDSASAILTLK
jgi:hypothetical protein